MKFFKKAMSSEALGKILLLVVVVVVLLIIISLVVARMNTSGSSIMNFFRFGVS